MIELLAPSIATRPTIAAQEDRRVIYDKPDTDMALLTGNKRFRRSSSDRESYYSGPTGGADPKEATSGAEGSGHVKVESSGIDAILSAFVARVGFLLSTIEDGASLDLDSAGQIIRLSERYISALSSHAEYRTFVATVSLAVKNSHEHLNVKRAAVLIRAMSEFKESEKLRTDGKHFTKTVINAGLSPLKV